MTVWHNSYVDSVMRQQHNFQTFLDQCTHGYTALSYWEDKRLRPFCLSRDQYAIWRDLLTRPGWVTQKGHGVKSGWN